MRVVPRRQRVGQGVMASLFDTWGRGRCVALARAKGPATAARSAPPRQGELRVSSVTLQKHCRGVGLGWGALRHSVEDKDDARVAVPSALARGTCGTWASVRVSHEGARKWCPRRGVLRSQHGARHRQLSARSVAHRDIRGSRSGARLRRWATVRGARAGKLEKPCATSTHAGPCTRAFEIATR